ncbi:MAG: hypothetical protein ACRDOH_14175 [Streptosporangiaceae bacterium]
MAYLGRSGWNTLRIGGAIPDDELIEAIDASYSAIVSSCLRKTALDDTEFAGLCSGAKRLARG